MIPCKSCLQPLSEQGGHWYNCNDCQYWIKYDPSRDVPIEIESFTRTVNEAIFTLTIDYEEAYSYLETLFGDTVWSTPNIIVVDSNSVLNKIRTILMFS